MADGRSPLAKLLLRVESRALRASERVVVDTTANAMQVARLFGVPLERIVTAPLALEEGETAASAALPRTDTLRVLFVGTFVPLQGTLVVAQAIHQLRDHEIEFVVIGNGQQAEAAAPLLESNPRVRWIRDWQSSAMLAGHMGAADICLGVFGGEGKAERVLPFKVYHALAHGKAVVTQSGYGTPGTPPIPCELVSPSAEALAEAIVALKGDAERRRALGQAARRYYLEHLDDAAVARAWRALLADMQG
ncbi:MAG TPA: glycosyltransferase [Luteimonas sp.]